MNSVSRFFDVLMGIIGIGMVTTLVAHPGTAKDITAGGDAFEGSLHAAEGS